MAKTTVKLKCMELLRAPEKQQERLAYSGLVKLQRLDYFCGAFLPFLAPPFLSSVFMERAVGSIEINTIKEIYCLLSLMMDYGR